MDNNGNLAQHLQWIAGEVEFARNEYLEVNRQQMQLRIIAVSTAGIIASVLFPLLFSSDMETASRLASVEFHLTTIIGLSLLGLSIFYALLGLIYVNLSGRRSTLVRYLRFVVPGYLNDLDKDLIVYKSTLRYDLDEGSSAEGLRKIFRNISGGVWSFCSACIFVISNLVCLLTWPLIFEQTYSQHVYLYRVIGGADLLLLLAIGVQWLHYKKWLPGGQGKKAASPELQTSRE